MTCLEYGWYKTVIRVKIMTTMMMMKMILMKIIIKLVKIMSINY